MLSILTAYLLGVLTVLTFMLVFALLDWLKDKAATTHYRTTPPPPPPYPPRKSKT